MWTWSRLRKKEVDQPVATGLLSPDVSLPMPALHQDKDPQSDPDVGQPQLADLGRVCVLARADGQPHWTGPRSLEPHHYSCLEMCPSTTEPQEEGCRCLNTTPDFPDAVDLALLPLDVEDLGPLPQDVDVGDLFILSLPPRTSHEQRRPDLEDQPWSERGPEREERRRERRVALPSYDLS